MAKGSLGSLYISIKADLDDVKRGLRQVQNEVGTASQKISQMGKAMTASFDQAHNAAVKVRQVVAGIGGTYVLSRLARETLSVASAFEQMKLKLDVLSKGRGDAIFDNLNQMALKLPISVNEVTDAYVRMQAMGLSPTNEKMKTLINTASVFGNEAMSRITRALGQMQTYGKVMSEEINQLSEAGINARKYLFQAFHMSVDDINKAGISVRDVIKVIMEGLEKDFGSLAEKRMNTLEGQWTRFINQMKESTRQFMESGLLQQLTSFLKQINDALEKINRNEGLKKLGTKVDLWMKGESDLFVSPGEKIEQKKLIEKLQKEIAIQEKGMEGRSGIAKQWGQKDINALKSQLDTANQKYKEMFAYERAITEEREKRSDSFREEMQASKYIVDEHAILVEQMEAENKKKREQEEIEKNLARNINAYNQNTIHRLELEQNIGKYKRVLWKQTIEEQTNEFQTSKKIHEKEQKDANDYFNFRRKMWQREIEKVEEISKAISASLVEGNFEGAFENVLSTFKKEFSDIFARDAILPLMLPLKQGFADAAADLSSALGGGMVGGLGAGAVGFGISMIASKLMGGGGHKKSETEILKEELVKHTDELKKINKNLEESIFNPSTTRWSELTKKARADLDEALADETYAKLRKKFGENQSVFYDPAYGNYTYDQFGKIIPKDQTQPFTTTKGGFGIVEDTTAMMAEINAYSDEVRKQFQLTVKAILLDVEKEMKSYEESLTFFKPSEFAQATADAKARIDEFEQGLIELGLTTEEAAAKVQGLRDKSAEFIQLQFERQMAKIGLQAKEITANLKPMNSYEAALKSVNDQFIQLMNQAADLGGPFTSQLFTLTQGLADAIKIIEEQFAAARISISNNASKIVADLISPPREYINQIFNLNEQFDELIRGMIDAGASMDEIQAIEDLRKQGLEALAQTARNTVATISSDASQLIADLIKPPTELETQIRNLNNQFDDFINAIREAGGSTKDIQAIENLRKIGLDALAKSAANATSSMMHFISLSDIMSPLAQAQESRDWALAEAGGVPRSEYLSRQIANLSGMSEYTYEDLQKFASLVSDWYTTSIEEATSKTDEFASTIEDAKNTVKDLLEQIDETIQSIKYSSLNVMLPQDKRAMAGQDYGKLLQKALGGNPEDVQKYLGFTEQYLQIAQEDLKSSQAYQDIYAQVMNDIEKVKLYVGDFSFENRLITETQRQTQVLMSIDSKIGVASGQSGIPSIDQKFNALQQNIIDAYRNMHPQQEALPDYLTQSDIYKDVANFFAAGATGPQEFKIGGGIATALPGGRGTFTADGKTYTFTAATPLEDIYRGLPGIAQDWNATFGDRIGQYADGGIATGPNSGYPAMLHGSEAVIPLERGAVPVRLNGNRPIAVNVYIDGEKISTEEIACIADEVRVKANRRNITNRRLYN